MVQQHNLLIRPSCLSEPSQLASLTPWKTKRRNFSRFAFCGGQGLLPAGQILVVLLGSRGVLFLLPLLGSASHCPRAWGSTHPQPLCVGLSYTAMLSSPLLGQQAEQGISRGFWVSCWLTAAALGVMDKYTWAKQHSSLASWVNVSQCSSFNLVTTSHKFCETLILIQNQNYLALTSFRL